MDHKITFSRNMDGNPLVLVNGLVAAIAQDCKGWEYLKAYCQNLPASEFVERRGKDSK
jgi:hypothetical protein